MKLRHADIFCGIGGFSEALQDIAEPIIACDIDKRARQVYMANYQPKSIYADLQDLVGSKELKIANIDILTAGIPCQPYSRMGHRKMLEDKRAGVIPLLSEAIKQANPKHILIECVLDFGKIFRSTQLAKTIEEMGYNYIKTGNFTGYEHDNPTRRKRWYLYCSRRELHAFRQVIKTNTTPTVTLSSLLNKNFEKQYAYTFRKGGQGSGITSRHNWDTYMVDGQPYTLTARDCLDVMGFRRNFIIPVYISERQMKSLIGNSICVNIPKWIVLDELD